MKKLTLLCCFLLGTLSFADTSEELKMKCSYNPEDLEEMSMSELGAKDGPLGLWYIEPTEYSPAMNLKFYYNYPDGHFRMSHTIKYYGLSDPVLDLKIGVCVYGERTFYKLISEDLYFEFYRENQYLFTAKEPFDLQNPASSEESTFTKAYPAKVIKL